MSEGIGGLAYVIIVVTVIKNLFFLSILSSFEIIHYMFNNIDNGNVPPTDKAITEIDHSASLLCITISLLTYTETKK
ncbi:MAG: hypothetical protein ACRD97_08545 [Nitrososphaeraceae archaeon]